MHPGTLDERSPPPELEEVQTYRRAARSIVRDKKKGKRDRLVALVKLVEKARAETALPDWCQRAIWEESARFIEGRANPVPLTSDPVEGACRRLLAKQLIRCPTCQRPLPDEATLDRWRSERLAALYEAYVREQAVKT